MLNGLFISKNIPITMKNLINKPVWSFNFNKGEEMDEKEDMIESKLNVVLEALKLMPNKEEIYEWAVDMILKNRNTSKNTISRNDLIRIIEMIACIISDTRKSEQNYLSSLLP